MLALRADLSGNPTVREFFARVRNVALEALENQEVPLEILVAGHGNGRDGSRSPLFQVMFVLQNNPMPEVGLPELTLSPLDLEWGTGTAKFDLALGFEDTSGGFRGSVEYNTDLFESSTIERFSRHDVRVLESSLAHPETPLSEMSFLSDKERGHVLQWSASPIVISDKTVLPGRQGVEGIHGLFEAQVQATPNRIALVAGTERLTYEELNKRANRLAHFLSLQGVGPEFRVGLFLEQPLNRIVAVLGVLKAGAAYVPLEPSSPRERLDRMLDAARVSVVIVERGTAGLLTSKPLARSIFVYTRSRSALEPSENPSAQADGDNLAYVVFTSGSTGRPKGVMVSHRNLVAAAEAWERSYSLRSPALSSSPGRWLCVRCLHGRLGSGSHDGRYSRHVSPRSSP